MSELHKLKIKAKQGRKVQIEVSILHPDEHNIIAESNFALQLILTLYETKFSHNFKDGKRDLSDFSFEGNPEKNKIAAGLFQKLQFTEVPISKEEYEERVEQNNYCYQDRQICSFGFLNGQYSVSLAPLYNDFCKEAEKYIELVEVISVQNFPHAFDSVENYIAGHQPDVSDDYIVHRTKQVPGYVLQITVNSESSFLIDDLNEGDTGYSACYNFLNYTGSYKPSLEPVFHTLAYSADNIGFSGEELSAWWSTLDTEWKIVLKMNLYIQQSLIFPQIRERFHGKIFRESFEAYFGKAHVSFLHGKNMSIDELRQIVRMKMIYLGGFYLENLEPLRIMKNLKLLHCEGGSIKNIDAICEMHTIEDLWLIFDEIGIDLTSLKCLANLKRLCVYINSQEEFNMLSAFPEVHDLRIYSGIEIKPLFLLQFKKIKTVSVCSTASTDKKEADTERVIQNLRESGVVISWQSEFFSDDRCELIEY